MAYPKANITHFELIYSEAGHSLIMIKENKVMSNIQYCT